MLVLVERSKGSQGELCITERGLWESGNSENIKNIHLFPVPVLFCYSKAYLFCSVNLISFCIFTSIIRKCFEKAPDVLKKKTSLYPGLLG